MYITKEEFQKIKKALELLPHGAEFNNLSKETQKIIVDADCAMMNLLKKRKDSNKKTAAYIAEKRKNNKNYAR